MQSVRKSWSDEKQNREKAFVHAVHAQDIYATCLYCIFIICNRPYNFDLMEDWKSRGERWIKTRIIKTEGEGEGRTCLPCREQTRGEKG